jgi:hypothetical protein
MKLLVAVSVSALLAATADAPNLLLSSSSASYGHLQKALLDAADAMPEADYSFRSSPDVRTFGGMLLRIASTQFLLCGTAFDGKPVMKSFTAAKTKADIVAALQESFRFCDGVYQKLTDTDAAAAVSFRGQPRTRLSILDLNIAFGFELYGNIAMYMRLRSIQPWSEDLAPFVPPPDDAPPAPEIKGVVPSAGLVPNQETAITIARAVLVPIYGRAAIAREEPLRARLKSGVWTVAGVLPPDSVGGTAVVKIAKSDGQILSVMHTM